MRCSSAIALALSLVLAAARTRAEERPFTFATDALTPAQGHVDGIYRGTWGIAPGGAVRAVGATGVGVGSVHELGAEAGLFSFLSLRAFGLAEISLRPDATVYGTAGAELRARLVGAGASAPFQLTLGAGAVREFTGYAALQARLTASGTAGPVRLTGELIAERSFRPRADAIDWVVAAGASVKLAPGVRVGAEYLGQDLEAAWTTTEFEGIRHLLGPSAAFAVLSERFQVTSGVAFGLSPGTPLATVRLGAVYTF